MQAHAASNDCVLDRLVNNIRRELVRLKTAVFRGVGKLPASMRERVVIVSYGMRRRVVGGDGRTDGRQKILDYALVNRRVLLSISVRACGVRNAFIARHSLSASVRFSRATPTLNDLLMNGVELTRATGAAAFSWSEASARLNNGWA